MGSNIVYGLQEDSVAINGRIFSDFPDGDIAILELPNELAEIKKDKNGKSIFAFKKTGSIVNFALRILKGSEDDRFLNTLLSAQNLNPNNFILLSGRFSKVITVANSDSLTVGLSTYVDKKRGVIAEKYRIYTPATATDTYLLNDGVFLKNPSLRGNTEGDVQTLVTEYHLQFATCIRTLGITENKE